jgi:hypothetical protein
MPIRTCKNGHLTGFRKCFTCGSKEVFALGGRGAVDPLVRDEHGDHPLLKVRRETRVLGNSSIIKTAMK